MENCGVLSVVDAQGLPVRLSCEGRSETTLRRRDELPVVI
jgi:hypothetical protein